MSLLTMIGRVTDGLLLAGSQDNHPDLFTFQKQAKSILKNLTASSPARCTIDASPYLYYYIIEDFVCYITLADKSYPGQLAFQYLEALNRQFQMDHAHELHRFTRPYAAIAFDTKLSRLRRQYIDPRSPDNVKKLNSNLNEIHSIMRANITEVLQRGEKMDRIENLTSNLAHESKKFQKLSRWLKLQAIYKAYLPFIIVALVIMFVLYIKFR